MADHDDEYDHDAHVGFVSPASLAGRAHTPEVKPEPKSEPAPQPQPLPQPEREPDLFDPPEPAPVTPRFDPTPEPVAKTEPGPFDRTEGFAAPVGTPFTSEQPRETFAKRAEQPVVPMSLYAVYVLILLAIPSLGVSAVLALLAVTGREGPQEPLAASHFIYQQRTLWAGAVAAVLGAVLVIVNVGVFVLFILALWLLARGAFGVLRLKSGQAIANPRSWLF